MDPMKRSYSPLLPGAPVSVSMVSFASIPFVRVAFPVYPVFTFEHS